MVVNGNGVNGDFESNTEPLLRLNLEGNTETIMKQRNTYST